MLPLIVGNPPFIGAAVGHHAGDALIIILGAREGTDRV